MLIRVRKDNHGNLPAMKHLKNLVAVAAVFALAGCNQPEPPTDEAAAGQLPLTTHEQKISYLAATDFANNFRAQGVELDVDTVALAVRDVMEGREVRLSQEEIAETVEKFRVQTVARQQQQAREQEENEAKALAEQNRLAEENSKAGTAFLTENGKKEGVVTLASGLQYKIIEQGSGPKPTASDTVKVHYRGTLLDGTEFDSSYKRDAPATFQLTQVISGWTEALQLMPEGSKWELYIPGDLAYGPGGVGEIGPNATLIFEVALLDASVAEPVAAEQEGENK